MNIPTVARLPRISRRIGSFATSAIPSNLVVVLATLTLAWWLTSVVVLKILSHRSDAFGAVTASQHRKHC
jgi:hypothetical protein